MTDLVQRIIALIDKELNGDGVHVVSSEALGAKKQVSVVLANEVVELSVQVRDMRHKTLLECQNICHQNGDDASYSDIASLILTLDNPIIGT